MARGEHTAKQQHQTKLANLRNKTKRKVDYQLQKSFIDPEDFYHLVTEFFLELLGKEYSATYEEILHELEHIEDEFLLFSKAQRTMAKNLLEQLSELQYHHEEIPQKTAKQILQEFHQLATEFTRFEEESIERTIRKAYYALQRDDKDAAMDAYQEAHRLYSKLGSDDQKNYFSDLQELYEKLHTEP